MIQVLQEKEENLQQLAGDLEEKDEQIKKLEGNRYLFQDYLELIENFKNLYEQMNDEKNVLTEENEKLQNEND